MNKVVLIFALLCFTLTGFAQNENDSTGITLNPRPKTTLTFGGAVWVNYAYQNWISPDQGRKRGLRFDNVRLSFD